MSESTQTSTSQQATTSTKAQWFVTGNDGIRNLLGGIVVVCFAMWFFMASMAFIAASQENVPGLARAIAVVAFMAVVWCAAFVRRGVRGIQASNAQFTALFHCIMKEREERAAWIASLPEGSFGKTPSQALRNAESDTKLALYVIDRNN